MRRPYMDDPYTELRRTIVGLKEEIVELTGVILTLVEVITRES